MFEVIAVVFCIGMVLSFYASNKGSIDKTRKDLDKVFKD